MGRDSKQNVEASVQQIAWPNLWGLVGWCVQQSGFWMGTSKPAKTEFGNLQMGVCFRKSPPGTF